MINKEHLALGIAALRSTRFRQGTKYLEYRDASGNKRHCCLGVLTRVAIENGLQISERVTDYGFSSFGAEESYGVLCQEVMEWYGFTSCDPDFRDITARNSDGETVLWESETASGCNDQFLMPFVQIANLFEKEYLTD
jgi:hypothetical protein